MSEQKIYRFSGTALDVEWDERLCIHIAECGNARGELFVGGRQPWCQPDLVPGEEVMEVVRRCPSGALSFTTKEGGAAERAAPRNTVQVSYNGPYFVQGELAIEGAPEDMPGIRFRAALCRCGESRNKPFCDNSHEAAGFKDYGAVGERGEAPGAEGGPLAIRARKDGPLVLTGNLTLRAASGRDAWHGKETALCRCGASKNKPFCDGSHKAAGFKSE